jgi:DNA-binding response OmpR family regulator
MRILVVEDEKKVANFIKHGLEEERYIVELAQDGITGLDIAMNNHFDAILLDVMLPGKDGFTLLREMRDAGFSTT